ncbi:hypothetical protein O0881_09290 [Janthinobacterium sp. SUN100]|uniref:hypothetical protein n=1 Tax=Janthinobacterium sp. SUN100 TaxID=3004101 RepID=UPI0025B12FFD|nr:hypothetical protein [Janthinobacterium sp. SUN100]MDN2702185.1 hypothetical protein [Janthinobacterium sp. SUN100]
MPAHGFALVFALFSLQLCAFKLLPFAGLNGGQALLAILLAWLAAFAWHGWEKHGDVVGWRYSFL